MMYSVKSTDFSFMLAAIDRRIAVLEAEGHSAMRDSFVFEEWSRDESAKPVDRQLWIGDASNAASRAANNFDGAKSIRMLREILPFTELYKLV